jgi:hypothetical protein
MAYVPFVDSKPVASDNGNDVIDDVRENLLAMRDAVVAGAFVGWDMTVTAGTGTTEQPQYIYLHRNGASTERIRVEYTWGTTGGADGNPTVMVFSYTADDDPLGSAVWSTMGTLTMTYNSDGTVASGAWS